MKIYLYAVAHNEAKLLPFFLQHYHWCDQITILDHNSTDHTREIALGYGARVVNYPGNPDLFDEFEFAQVSNLYWMQDRDKCDWVIWVDIDEFLICKSRSMVEYLHYCDAHKITLPTVQGYTMIAPYFPITGKPLVERFTRGVKDKLYSKRAVFSTKLEQINYGFGRHACGPSPDELVMQDEFPHLALLHYPYFGDDYYIARRYRLHQRRGNQGPFYLPLGERYSLDWFRTVATEDVRG